MVSVGHAEVSGSSSEAAETPRQAHALDNKANAEARGAGQTTDSSSSPVSDLNDGDYTTGGSLFPGSHDTTDTYAWALASGEAQAGVPW
ncbi:predicted protein [Chaetomium globosum CBS 148.51]|uniref:Uncharacterized protein n=1 Tax=Chaetomium globosum (strain ATCC 6205 / CBS 148.51 / DSM 1962 / NBRC 6347 / NRRL 1970) TaxID=306901 RepID=Q2H545_CHAGB|nr:uncharacterized protein CHGG_06220 [Chaetomium globosum CBS 148.51]EAQ89601.1 predicted protein [Chaetomium globosum CBS 148.51]